MAPYMSFIAISNLGFSNQGYSLILIVASSVVSLASAVAMGIVTDQRPCAGKWPCCHRYLLRLAPAVDVGIGQPRLAICHKPCRAIALQA